MGNAKSKDPTGDVFTKLLISAAVGAGMFGLILLGAGLAAIEGALIGSLITGVVTFVGLFLIGCRMKGQGLLVCILGDVANAGKEMCDSLTMGACSGVVGGIGKGAVGLIQTSVVRPLEGGLTLFKTGIHGKQPAILGTLGL